MNQIANCDIKLLAAKYGTPLYVYDKQKISDNYLKLKNAFEKYYPNTAIHFSVKANSNLNILKVFKELGCGADCSSPFEYLLTQKAGFDSSKILYTGNYESIDDFSTLDGNDIKLNLDDISSFRKLKQVGLPERVSFRINPGMGRGGHEGITTGGTEAKFGIPYEKAIDAYQEALDAGVQRFGIHMMTGSNNLEPYFFAEIVDKLLKIASGIFSKIGKTPEYVDIGGGFGIPYNDDEPELDIDLTAKVVTEVFKEKCEKYNFGTPQLILEPGRFLVANAGFLVTEVTGVKESYRKFIGLNAGMNTLIRPALYGAHHRIRPYQENDIHEIVNVCGQICENSDIFVKNISLPVQHEGDILTFLDAGAYGYVMASNYNNRPRPAEILVDNGNDKLIRRREVFEDFLRLYPEE
jgi:diaminopimelate decarboxylase